VRGVGRVRQTRGVPGPDDVPQAGVRGPRRGRRRLHPGRVFRRRWFRVRPGARVGRRDVRRRRVVPRERERARRERRPSHELAVRRRRRVSTGGTHTERRSLRRRLWWTSARDAQRALELWRRRGAHGVGVVLVRRAGGASDPSERHGEPIAAAARTRAIPRRPRPAADTPRDAPAEAARGLPRRPARLGADMPGGSVAAAAAEGYVPGAGRERRGAGRGVDAGGVAAARPERALRRARARRAPRRGRRPAEPDGVLRPPRTSAASESGDAVSGAFYTKVFHPSLGGFNT
jgi:hypothetical protein